MIVTFVTYPAKSLPREESRRLLAEVAPKFQEIPGLLRKYFIGDGTLAGGVYVWRDRASAELYLDEAWRRRMADSYGGEPQVVHFDCPALVDNLAGSIELQ